ncbi:FlgO family outer membrane protein [Pararhizobium antarcticum]|uniref:FlgO family outer membrane protein n=1 Tax=Pararhizobium antarcticum TaxID=1798805 RepID=UPI000AC28991|nr:FlgO family outer membrane protein [Pararhizobium antarcticum]
MQDTNTIGTRRPPNADDIRAQLERIVTSPEFPTVGRGAAFLTYIVEETICGRANRLKGYSIALEIFRRGENFSQDDPVVRIEAGRLRRALERYYLVAGQTDSIRIDIPKGGYIPVFTWNCPGSIHREVIDKPDISEIRSLARASWWSGTARTLGLFAGLAVFFGFTAYWTLPYDAVTGTSPTARLQPDKPTVLVAPFVNLGDGPQSHSYAIGLTEQLLTTLPRFKEIKVFEIETSRSLLPQIDVAEVRERFAAQYLLAGGVRVAGDRLRASVRLLDTRDGAILWSQSYDHDLRSGDLFTIQTDVANRVAASVAQPYGIIAQAEVGRPPPDDLGTYKCALDFYEYRIHLSVERHGAVRNCLEQAVERSPAYSTARAMLSMIYLDEERYKFNPTTEGPPPIERALQAARQAIQVEPDNTRAQQALMMALFFDRQLAEATHVGEHAIAMNPNDTEVLGEFGTRIAIAGQWQRGAELLDQAIALNPRGGGFYRGMRGLASYMLGDTVNAVLQIKRSDMQKFPLFHGVAAIIYAEAGMTVEAGRAAAVFKTMRPDFLPNFVSEMTSRNMRDADLNRLVEGLRKAGMTIGDDERAFAYASEPP